MEPTQPVNHSPNQEPNNGSGPQPAAQPVPEAASVPQAGSPEPAIIAPSDPAPQAPAPTAEAASQPSTPWQQPSAAAPAAPAIVTGGADQPQSVVPAAQTYPGSTTGGGKKKWLLPTLVAVVALILLGGGYVFGYYLPNRPSAVYSKSLSNSGKAVDALVSYTDGVSKQNYKSYGLDGSLNFKSTSGSIDGTVTGAFDAKGNGNLKLGVDALGEKVNAEIRSSHAGTNTTPDLYVQVTGVKDLLNSVGATSLSGLDGQWIAIDHTLLDTYASNLQGGAGMTSPSSVPTADEIHDAAVKVQAVNKQYLFTADSSKAVLKQDSYVGKETRDGRSVYHYQVSADQAHGKAYVAALKSALDSSSLNDWYKKANNGKNISASLDSLGSSSDTTGDFADKADLWADTKTKLVHAIRFTDKKNSGSSVTLTQNYTGGDDYPFDINFTDKTSGTAVNGDVKLAVNKKTNIVNLGLTGSQDSNTYGFNLKLTPSNNGVQVTTPANAVPIVTVLSQLGLSGGL